MRFVNHQSFPRWIHWFWITGILFIQPGLLRCEDTTDLPDLLSSSTTSKTITTTLTNNNTSVSHTISVVSVLYSSDESSETNITFHSSFHNSSVPTNTTTVRTPPQEEEEEETTLPQPADLSFKIISTTTTPAESSTLSPSTTTPILPVALITNMTKLEDTLPELLQIGSLAPSSSETPSHKPGERVRGGKEGRSLMHHSPVIVRVFDKNDSKVIEEEMGRKSQDKNRSAVEIISDTTFILREQGSHVDLGESTGSLLTFKDSGGEEDEPSKESTASGMSTNMLVGIIIGTLLLMIIGTVGFGVLIYHEKFANKPQTLDDNYANSDSGGIYNFSTTEDFFRRISHIECGGFDIGRDTYSEEMYNLDNDSFLNSLEAMTFPSYSPEMNNRSTFSNDSGV